MTKHLFKVLILLTFFGGCKIAPMGYVSIAPYAKPFQKKISIPLNIYLSEDVKDSLVVEGEGIKKMKVTEFRKSCSDGFKKIFQKNFDNVTIIDKSQENGLTLIIYRIRPFWSRTGSYTTTSSNGQGGQNTTTTSFISAAFQFETSLFFNGKKIANADGKAFSDGQMSSVGQAHRVFQDGLKVTIEAIEKNTFTDVVVDKINGQ